MNLLVYQINQKYEDIKYLMKDTWLKLISLEKSLGELQCAKIPLICYGDKDSNGQITFSNLDSYSCQSKKPLPSVVEWMNQFGYNTHRASWQNALANQPRITLERPIEEENIDFDQNELFLSSEF